MKRFICVLLSVITVLFLFASCGKKNGDKGGDITVPEKTTVSRVPNKEIETNRNAPSVVYNTVADAPTNEAGMPDYIKPVDDEALDLDKDSDISSDKMKFTYDESGRISTCSYTANGMPMNIEYSYPTDGGIAIFGFCNGTMVIDTVYYPTRGFDAALGFTAYDGMYFFGYDFSA